MRNLESDLMPCASRRCRENWLHKTTPPPRCNNSNLTVDLTVLTHGCAAMKEQSLATSMTYRIEAEFEEPASLLKCAELYECHSCSFIRNLLKSKKSKMFFKNVLCDESLLLL